MSNEDEVIPPSTEEVQVAEEGAVKTEPTVEDVVLPDAVQPEEPTIPVTVIASDNGDIVATTTLVETVIVTAEAAQTTEVAADENAPAAVAIEEVPPTTDNAETPLPKRKEETTTPAPVHTAPNGEQFVTEIRAQDVLFGRGGNAIHHSGNISFRTLIQEKKQIYTSSCRRQVKDMVAVEVYNTVTENGGRFLRESTAADLTDIIDTPSGKSGKIWTIADQQTSINKIKQALREVDTNTGTPNTPSVPSSMHGVEFVPMFNQGGTPGVSGSDADGGTGDEDANLPRKKRKYTKAMPLGMTTAIGGTIPVDMTGSTSTAIRTYNDSFLHTQLNDFKESIHTMMEQLLEAHKQDLLHEITNIMNGTKTEKLFEVKVEETTVQMEAEPATEPTVNAEPEDTATKMETEIENTAVHV
jgi:hypothetical protein